MKLRLVPRNAGERWSVVSAVLYCGKLQGTLDVQYLYEQLPEELMGVDLRLFTADGEELPGGGGYMITYTDQEETADGARIYRALLEIQSLDVVPETLILQPKVIDSYNWLEPIVCDVMVE